MKRQLSIIAILTMVLAITTFTGCKKDASPILKTSYPLLVKGQLGVSGTVTFTQTSSSVTTISIVLTGADSAYHPAYIRTNAAVEGGGVAITLNPVIGGLSTTVVTKLDNQTSINYSELIMFDGYLDIDESSSNQGLIIAQGDIGGNALTTTNVTYQLDTVGALGVSGVALFTKRTNGNTLISVSLTGAIAGGMYPEAIHLGSVTTVGGGPVAKTLSVIDGSTGKAYTNVRTLDNGTVITYAGLTTYDGYISVVQSATAPVILCQGNIGTH